ncbi:DUF4136 domain-containing protein [Paraflavitalea pollutisoli]|uniref:DUF4136 domain-containing protein n=1 Tax=Paraflavitalea pollutisoli TaxID=3034143 RepID=UPI0023EC1FE1|nr:DUF4136 domain-containing protein [Paraflavitalea sp. H1-2-19X]
MTSKSRYWLAVFLLPVMWGCYPKGAEYDEDLDLVYTNYYDQFDFKAKKTYAMSDSVIKITGDQFTDPDGDGKPTFLSATYAVPIVTELKKQMAENGWTLVNKNANPDVILLTSSMTTTNVYYYYDWWYWDWWYPGWYDWGWYYPGYYYPAYVTGYRSGSVFVQMVDHQAGKNADNIPVVWSSIINGLAEGSTTNLVGRITNSIDKAFAQSPYLKH